MASRAVFFDLGGTLLVMRRDRIFRRVINECGRDEALERIHAAYMGLDSWWLSTYSTIPMTPEQTVEAYRHLDEMVFRSLFRDADGAEALKVSGFVRSRWHELEREIPLELYPDVEPALTRLAGAGYKMGLISNAPADTERVVKPLGLDRFLATVVFSGSVGYTKPNPEIFRIAMHEAGAVPEQSVHVGDLYEADVVGARGAGMKGVLLDRLDAQGTRDCPRVTTLDDIFSQL